LVTPLATGRRPTSERLASRARCDKLVRPRRDGQSRAS
jgi:hypothetical protein